MPAWDTPHSEVQVSETISAHSHSFHPLDALNSPPPTTLLFFTTLSSLQPGEHLHYCNLALSGMCLYL